MSKIINIPLDKLKLHPQNVRKKYEGIEELARALRQGAFCRTLLLYQTKVRKVHILLLSEIAVLLRQNRQESVHFHVLLKKWKKRNRLKPCCWKICREMI